MDDNDLRKQIQKAEELSKLLNNTDKKSLTDKYCSKCFGLGVQRCWDDDREIKCTRCGGTGKEPLQSNYDWLNSLPIEEQAEAIANLVFRATGEYNRERYPSNRWFKKEYWLEWLKEKHAERSDKINKRINKLQTIANKYRVKVTFNANETEDKNNAGYSGNEIWLGEFDDVDLLTIAFFHELAHCLSQEVLVHRKYCLSRLADEGFAWEYGFELAARHGYTWDIKHQVYKYAEKNLLSYATKETIRTCINCKRAEKFDDNFINCIDGLIHISMAQEMADGCLEYSPKELL